MRMMGLNGGDVGDNGGGIFFVLAKHSHGGKIRVFLNRALAEMSPEIFFRPQSVKKDGAIYSQRYVGENPT